MTEEVFLTDCRSKIIWEGTWIYIGSNYLQMRKCEVRIGGPRESIENYIRLTAKDERENFLNWIERQRILNGDSVNWWMNHIAGRNNAYSMLFIHWIQIMSLRSWLFDNRESHGAILVVCEDSFIKRTVKMALQHQFQVKSSYRNNIYSVVDFAWLLSRALHTVIRQVSFFWRHYWVAKRTRPTNQKWNGDQVFLLHLCLDDAALLSDERLTSRYFRSLPRFLEEKGYKVARLPWFFDVTISLTRAYQKIRESNCFVPEDWLKLREYPIAIINHLRSSQTLRSEILPPSLNIRPLIEREKLIQLGDNSAVFWRYAPALRRWAASFKTVVNVNHFEGMPGEHIQAYIGRNLKCRFVDIGYVHTIVSKDFLIHHFPKGVWSSPLMPDWIMTNGSLYRDVLIERGAPRDRVISGPALRQHFEIGFSGKSECGKDIVFLVLLPMVPQAVAELMETMWTYVEPFREKHNGAIRIKLHPTLNEKIVLDSLHWSRLPQDWQWESQEVPNVFENVSCAFSMNTSSTIDAVLAGCKIITIGRELDLAWNNLDMLESEYSILRTSKKEDIVDVLIQLLWTRKEIVSGEMISLRKRLRRGINPITSEWLDKFIEVAGK